LMLTTKTLMGNWGTLLLPIDQDNSISYNRLEEEINALIKAKVDGIYSNGTAGELHNQTEREFDKINSLLAETCHLHKVSFQIGVSHPCPVTSLERLERSVDLHPDAFQLILPDWVVVNRREQVTFLEKMAEAAKGTPLVLYNPPHAKAVLQPSDFAELSAVFPQLIGLKVAPVGSHWYEEMRNHSSGLAVFLPGHWLATGVRERVAAGSYSNVACLSPAGAQWWWRLIKTDLMAAIEVESRIQQLFSQCIEPFIKIGYSNPALDKFLAAVGGWSPIGTRLRWPYNWISEEEISHVKKVACQLLPEFFI
ncbi:MAG: dihydrodipicolinate synthase family protein, partial [Chitinophagaceae bacterium]